MISVELTGEIVITFIVRFVNALLWSALVIKVFREDRPITRLARQIILPVLFVGMWLLAIGSLVALGIIPAWVARNLYTLFTGAAALTAAVLLTGGTKE